MSHEKPRCIHDNLEEDCPFCVEPDYRIVPRPAPKDHVDTVNARQKEVYNYNVPVINTYEY